jgi:hypothetical protein
VRFLLTQQALRSAARARPEGAAAALAQLTTRPGPGGSPNPSRGAVATGCVCLGSSGPHGRIGRESTCRTGRRRGREVASGPRALDALASAVHADRPPARLGRPRALGPLPRALHRHRRLLPLLPGALARSPRSRVELAFLRVAVVSGAFVLRCNWRTAPRWRSRSRRSAASGRSGASSSTSTAHDRQPRRDGDRADRDRAAPAALHRSSHTTPRRCA